MSTDYLIIFPFVDDILSALSPFTLRVTDQPFQPFLLIDCIILRTSIFFLRA